MSARHDDARRHGTLMRCTTPDPIKRPPMSKKPATTAEKPVMAGKCTKKGGRKK